MFVELCFTPTNASWTNLIEAAFGPLRNFVMANSDCKAHPALARRLQDYVGATPMPASPICWPPSVANEPAFAANASYAGVARNLKPHDRTDQRWWPAH